MAGARTRPVRDQRSADLTDPARALPGTPDRDPGEGHRDQVAGQPEHEHPPGPGAVRGGANREHDRGQGQL